MKSLSSSIAFGKFAPLFVTYDRNGLIFLYFFFILLILLILLIFLMIGPCFALLVGLCIPNVPC